MAFIEIDEHKLYINSYSLDVLHPILNLIEEANPNSSVKTILLENNIILSALQAPASILLNCSVNIQQGFQLVGIDVGLCRVLHKFDSSEIGAALLHEIGHIFNPLKNKKELNDELLAMPPLNPMRFKNSEEFLAAKNRHDEIKHEIKYGEEFCADDYAIKFNYGRYIMSSLQKMLDTAAYSSDEQIGLLRKRVERLSSLGN